MKLLKLLTIISLILLTCSCNNETIIDNISDKIPEEDKQIISSLGLDINTLVDIGEFYIVEGDIILEKGSMNEYLNQDTSKLKQARHVNTISRKNIRPITVGVSNTLKVSGRNHWYTEILQALDEWNNISPECGIYFVYTTNTNSDIMISDDGNTLGNDVLAVGAYPKNGKPGPYIKINLDFWSNYTLSSSQKKYNMVHELGHTLGLIHTNWAGLYEYPGSTIPGTPEAGNNPDPNSVMNAGTALNSWNGFSNYDRIAIIELYPSFILNIFVSHTGGIGSIYNRTLRIITSEYEPIFEGMKYKWSIDPIIRTEEDLTKNTIRLKVIFSGLYEFSVVASDAYGKSGTISTRIPKTFTGPIYY